MSHKCEYCNRTFSGKYTLKSHQKTAKYCLKLRGKESKFKCSDCEKIFTTKQNLSIHKKSCTIKNSNLIKKFLSTESNLKTELEKCQKKNETLEIENRLLKKQVEDLQNGLFRAAERPTTTNNTSIERQIVQNLVQITPEHLEKSAENLTIKHIEEKGVNGYRNFLLEYPLKNGFFTKDYSRRIITFVDENGKVVVDPNMMKLLQRVCKAIESRNTELIDERVKEIMVYVTKNSSELLSDELALHCEKQRKMMAKKEFIDEMAKGSINGSRQEIMEAFQTLTKDLCKHGMCSKDLEVDTT